MLQLVHIYYIINLKYCYLIKHICIITQEIHHLNRVSIIFLCSLYCVRGYNTGNIKEGKV